MGEWVQLPSRQDFLYRVSGREWQETGLVVVQLGPGWSLGVPT